MIEDARRADLRSLGTPMDIEIAHQAADHLQLLEILFAEKGEIRQRLQQQLGHHGGNATKEMRSAGAT